MAWNEIPAKEDPSLSFQPYYVRLNTLGQFLSPFSMRIFTDAWNSTELVSSTELRKSMLAGRLLIDIIRAFSLGEIVEGGVPVGGWFVHSGITKYSNLAGGARRASIGLPDGSYIHGTVRKNCEITATASANMVGEDEISLVIGRLLSPTKFDLIAAGYRDPIATLKGFGRAQETGSDDFGSVIRAVARNPRWTGLPILQYEYSDAVLLEAAVVDALERFAVAIRDQGAWKLLYGSDGTPVSEQRHQDLFRIFANMVFHHLEIDIHPGADHGNGATDLTISLRNIKWVIEFKKDRDKAAMVRGLVNQLPAYMRSVGTNYGAFIVLCHDRDPETVKAILDQEREMMAGNSRNILVDTIDCRRQVSASKIGRA